MNHFYIVAIAVVVPLAIGIGMFQGPLYAQ